MLYSTVLPRNITVQLIVLNIAGLKQLHKLQNFIKFIYKNKI